MAKSENTTNFFPSIYDTGSGDESLSFVGKNAPVNRTPSASAGRFQLPPEVKPLSKTQLKQAAQAQQDQLHSDIINRALQFTSSPEYNNMGTIQRQDVLQKIKDGDLSVVGVDPDQFQNMDIGSRGAVTSDVLNIIGQQNDQYEQNVNSSQSALSSAYDAAKEGINSVVRGFEGTSTQNEQADIDRERATQADTGILGDAARIAMQANGGGQNLDERQAALDKREAEQKAQYDSEQRRRQQEQTALALDKQRNSQYTTEQAGDSSLGKVAGMVRDFVAHPSVASDGLAEGAPAIVGGAGATALGVAARNPTLTAAGLAVVGGGTGFAQGGDAARQQVYAMTDNQLLSSTPIQEELNNGATLEQARNRVAERAANDNATRQALLGVLTSQIGVGSLSRGLTERGVGAIETATGREIGTDIAKNTIANTAASVVGQEQQNQAVRDNADSNVGLTDNLEQAAVSGLGMTLPFEVGGGVTRYLGRGTDPNAGTAQGGPETPPEGTGPTGDGTGTVTHPIINENGTVSAPVQQDATVDRSAGGTDPLASFAERVAPLNDVADRNTALTPEQREMVLSGAQEAIANGADPADIRNIVDTISTTRNDARLSQQHVTGESLFGDNAANEDITSALDAALDGYRDQGTQAASSAAPEARPAPRSLETSTPRYNYRQDSYSVNFEDPLDKAAYIVGNRGKGTKADAELTAYLRDNGISLTDARLRASDIRKDLASQHKAGPDSDVLTVSRRQPAAEAVADEEMFTPQQPRPAELGGVPIAQERPDEVATSNEQPTNQPSNDAGATGYSESPTNTVGSEAVPERVAPEPTVATDRQAEDAGTGEQSLYSAGQAESDAGTTQAAGSDSVGEQGDSGRYNQPVSPAVAGLGEGERGAGGETVGRDENAGGADSSGVQQRGDQSYLEVGHTVSFAGGNGARAFTGTVDSIAKNGNITVRRDDTGKLKKGIAPAQLTRTGDIGTPQDNAAAEQPAVSPATSQSAIATEEVITPVNAAIQQGAPNFDAPANTTPLGRNVDKLRRTSNRLMNDESLSAIAEDLQNALDIDDRVRADAIAEELHNAGVRGMERPNESSGAAAEVMRNADESILEPAERLVLNNAFLKNRENLPPEAASRSSMRDTLVSDAMAEQAGDNTRSSVWGMVNESVRNIARKMAKALAGIVIAVSLWHGVEPHDAMASVGHSSVAVIHQVDGLTRDSSAVNSWVREHNDNGGKPYIIADKQSGEIHIMSADGKVISTSPALFGVNRGDAAQLRQTPAGIFSIRHESAPASYGGDWQHFTTATQGNMSIQWGIHRVLTTGVNAKQHRVARLNSEGAADNRISLGCINIPADVYDKYLAKDFGGKLYIMPEQRKLGDVFHGIREVAAQQDLMPGKTMADVKSHADQSAQVIKSSTTGRAATDPAARHAVELRQSNDHQLQDNQAASMSNDIADGVLGAGVAASVIAAAAAASRRRRAGRLNASGETTVSSYRVDDPPISILDVNVPPETPMSPNSTGGIPAGSIRNVMDSAKNKDNRVTRTVNTLKTVATQISSALNDRAAHLQRRLIESGALDTSGNGIASHFMELFRGQVGVQRNLKAQLVHDHMLPILEHAANIAKDLGLSDVVTSAEELASWRLTQHVPEGNRVLRDRLVSELRQASTSLNGPAITEARRRLSTFDDMQAGTADKGALKALNKEVGPGDDVVNGLTGGMTDAEARSIAAHLEQKYGRANVEAINERMTTMLERINKHMVDSGMVTREELAQMPEFDYFVPTYTDRTLQSQTTGRDMDVYVGVSPVNPKGIYRRLGSESAALNPLVSMSALVNRVSANMSAVPVKAELHRIFESYPELATKLGLRRISVAAENRVKSGAAASHQSAIDADATGLIYRAVEEGENGEPVRNAYKYYFAKQNADTGMFEPDRQMMNAFFSNVSRDSKEDNPTLTMLRSLHAGSQRFQNLYQRGITKYQLPFAVFQYLVQDPSERAANITKNALVRQDGSTINAYTANLRLRFAARNPLVLGALMANEFGNGALDSATIAARNELRERGALSNYNNANLSDTSSVRNEIRRAMGPMAKVRKLDHVFSAWSESFGNAVAVAQYMELQKMGMSKDAAAAKILDAFDMNRSGLYTRQISAMIPFFKPATEGARHLLDKRWLTTKQGALTIAANATSAALVTGLLSGMYAAAGMDQDDQSLADAVGYMTVPDFSGGTIRIPIAHGMPKLVYALMVGGRRVVDGRNTWGELREQLGNILYQETQPTDVNASMDPNAVMATIGRMFMPSYARPFYDAEMNTSSFGTQIYTGAQSNAVADPTYLSAKSKTPEVWVDLSKKLNSWGLGDHHPESLRYITRNFIQPISAAWASYLEQDSKYMTAGEESNQQQVGPMATLLGAGRFRSPEDATLGHSYFEFVDSARDIMKRYGVAETGNGQRGKTGSNAEGTMQLLTNAGATSAEVRRVQVMLEAEAYRKKINSGLTQVVKDARKQNLSPTLLQNEFLTHNVSLTELYRQVSREGRNIK